MWLVSRAARLAGVDARWCYYAAEFGFYVLAAYALRLAICEFTESRRERFGGLIGSLFAVPMTSLLVLPALISPSWAPIQLPQLPGIGDFVWWSSDGFFHGISGSALVTFGTALTLLSFALIARYLRTGNETHLRWAALVTLVSAAIHPFEVLVIASAGPLAIVLARGRNWRTGIRPGVLLACAGFAGLLPYIVTALRHPWVRDVAELNRWSPYPPLRLLVMLGVPLTAALVLSCFRGRAGSSTDLLLKTWVGCTLVGIYLPWTPHAQHLLDGIHYAGGLLLVRELSRTAVLAHVRGRWRGLLGAGVIAYGVLAGCAYTAYYVQSFRDGQVARPRHLFSTVAPEDEVKAISWMREHAGPDDLVLAPRENAPWFATRPMHSMASHQLFSVTYEDQSACSDAFFRGGLSPKAADAFLDWYGVRFIILPEQSPAAAYLSGSVERARFGSLHIVEIDGNRMKQYPPNGRHRCGAD
jgi:hypothetical protein